MIKEDLDKLFMLQEIDYEMAQLHKRLNLYPPMLKRLENNLERKRQELEQTKNEQKERLKERRLMEKEILFRQEEVQKKQNQQMAPKIKQDAYNALKREIDKLKEEISRLEDKVLQYISKDEEMEAVFAEAERNFKHEEEDAQMERQRIQEQIDSKNRRLAELEKEREKHILLVPGDLLTYYNRYIKTHVPPVLVRVEQDSCGGCHMRILPQIIVEIHRGEKMVTCEGCRRILISKE